MISSAAKTPIHSVVAQLSSGAFGSVYYAKYEGNEKSVVLKSVRASAVVPKVALLEKQKMLLCVIYEYYFAQFKFYFVLKLEQECYS